MLLLFCLRTRFYPAHMLHPSVPYFTGAVSLWKKVTRTSITLRYRNLMFEYMLDITTGISLWKKELNKNRRSSIKPQFQLLGPKRHKWRLMLWLWPKHTSSVLIGCRYASDPFYRRSLYYRPSQDNAWPIIIS